MTTLIWQIVPAFYFRRNFFRNKNLFKDLRRYRLDYPNFEVRESFQNYILAALSNNEITKIDSLSFKLNQALYNRETN